MFVVYLIDVLESFNSVSSNFDGTFHYLHCRLSWLLFLDDYDELYDDAYVRIQQILLFVNVFTVPAFQAVDLGSSRILLDKHVEINHPVYKFCSFCL